MTESPSLVPGRPIAFDAYRLDIARHRLWRGENEIPLRPKSWDVLCYLVDRPGLLVTKEAIHREVWPDTAVSDNTLTQVITDLRQALGDSPRTPRIIETVHGRGFRFVAEVRSLGDETRGRAPAAEDWAPMAAPLRGETAPAFVGRQAELARLHECLNLAGQGARQLVFITGEAGIGKTTLSEEFLRATALRDPSICILHGQCIRQHGPREPYMPVLQALERLLRSSRGPSLIPVLRRVAPCWYLQIPWLVSEEELPGLQGTMISAAPQRMLREFGAFLESMAAQSTVVLLLEDLHWSDHATTDLLSFLAERRDPARLLIIATYGPAEVSMQDHPIREVRHTLRLHGRCVDLALPYLAAADLREYLHRRFGALTRDLASLIHERTDGNPLFVVAIVEELIRRGQLTNTDRGWVVDVDVDRADLAVPDDLTEMVTVQFRGLGSDERTVLEAASVAGVIFAPWTVAQAVGRDVEAIEAIAQQLVRSHLFLTVAGRAGDRASARLYEFSHAVHQQVIYEQVTDGARRRLHQAIGKALESACGDRLAEIAPELSVHFERSHDHARAIKYFGLCIS
jgi:predicted ATPase/DNA-binding winged helix-turn-helix (wHTH) protein